MYDYHCIYHPHDYINDNHIIVLDICSNCSVLRELNNFHNTIRMILIAIVPLNKVYAVKNYQYVYINIMLVFYVVAPDLQTLLE